jgi:melanoma-associated antigen p97
MQMIFYDQADLMQLETGLSYTAGEYYNMMPLVAEKYVSGNGDEGLAYLAVAVARKDNPSINFNTLQNKRVCFPGVGRAAGWIYPISTLMEKKMMDIVECNVPVKSADAYFSGMCAPDALARYYNPFGNNPTTVCENCVGKMDAYCTCNDPYADFPGAFRCMATGHGDVTFVRNTTVYEYLTLPNNTATAADFELLCLDGTRASVDSAATCNWGTIASHTVMTSLTRDPTLRDSYKTLLMMLSIDFGDAGASTDLFQMFDSLPFGQPNLMFSDETLMFKDINQVAGGSRNSYYTWAGAELYRRLIVLNSCPIHQARWCVISSYEMQKCENMIMAFAAKNLKPDLNCIMGTDVQDCISKIKIGDADLITLDASDIYMAGRKFGLVPIASEDYGGSGLNAYYAVAVARRRDTFLTLFNLKQRRSCHGGMMTAAGWVVAVDKLIETGQIRVIGCDVNRAVSQYFSKSCVPGILMDYYNPYHTNPVSLCEACGTSGPKRCLRNDEELYYGSSGAFRCVTEMGGDVAFVRHTTVRENTDGRNQADWARNRRSDDYELLCNDGTRMSIDDWETCNLAMLPPNAVVTAGFKTQKERDIYWTLLNFAQQFYDADTNPDFPMFDSTVNHKDLIFQDATVRLVSINPNNQTYTAYLGPNFVRAMQRMAVIDCVTGSTGVSMHLPMISRWLVALLAVQLWLRVV